jgi:hypothetical protein
MAVAQPAGPAPMTAMSTRSGATLTGREAS